MPAFALLLRLDLLQNITVEVEKPERALAAYYASAARKSFGAEGEPAAKNKGGFQTRPYEVYLG
jgi:hypothetical protein